MHNRVLFFISLNLFLTYSLHLIIAITLIVMRFIFFRFIDQNCLAIAFKCNPLSKPHRAYIHNTIENDEEYKVNSNKCVTNGTNERACDYFRLRIFVLCMQFQWFFRQFFLMFFLQNVLALFYFIELHTLVK